MNKNWFLSFETLAYVSFKLQQRLLLVLQIIIILSLRTESSPKSRPCVSLSVDDIKLKLCNSLHFAHSRNSFDIFRLLLVEYLSGALKSRCEDSAHCEMKS